MFSAVMYEVFPHTISLELIYTKTNEKLKN